jgi:hypothetical protein
LVTARALSTTLPAGLWLLLLLAALTLGLLSVAAWPAEDS